MKTRKVTVKMAENGINYSVAKIFSSLKTSDPQCVFNPCNRKINDQKSRRVIVFAFS